MTLLDDRHDLLPQFDVPVEPREFRGTSVYAIAFDLVQSELEQHYHNNSYKNAYKDIDVFLSARGFSHPQGSVYMGNETVTAVSAVLAIQDLAKQFAWFAPSVKDIRMFRIEEMNDLRPAIDSATTPS